MLFVRRNALQVIVPTYGIESNIFMDGGESGHQLDLCYDESEPSLTVEGVTFRLFDKLRVKIVIEEMNLQQSRLTLKLVSPKIPGVSVDEEKRQIEQEEDSMPPAKKAKMS